MTLQNPSSNIKAKEDPGIEENVIGSIIVKTVGAVAIGIVAWYFLQHMI
ncbi:MAG TPA: hypothetical protein PKM25_19280 [Candidatus Ozemobacteraceae bacterium]|nr:hypothetical protein [Candidatus Ozemobacteraceae bacterium]